MGLDVSRVAQLGDIIVKHKGWGQVLDPPTYVVITERHSHASVEGLIADRGALDAHTAIHGTITFCGGREADEEIIVSPDEIPDEIWAKIAMVQLLNEGEKP